MSPSTHRYPLASLAADYGRAAAGLAFTALPVLAVQAAPPVAWVLGVLACLFAAYAIRTALRHMTVIVMDQDGLRAEGPLAAAARWDALRSLRVAFYATRRERRNGRGWMQLKLRGGGRSLAVDSTIAGFDAIVRRAAEAARRNRLAYDPATAANLLSLGVDPGEAVGTDLAGMAAS